MNSKVIRKSYKTSLEEFKRLCWILLFIIVVFTTTYCITYTSSEVEMELSEIVPSPSPQEEMVEVPAIMAEEPEWITVSYPEELDNPLNLTEEEFRLFCYASYAEAGGETKDCLIGTMWAIKNFAIQMGSMEEALFYPNKYASLWEDGKFHCNKGELVQDEFLSEKFIEVAKKVISGDIQDPTNGSVYFLSYKRLGYMDPDEFAKVFKIEEYVVLGEHIFFQEWTEELNNL